MKTLAERLAWARAQKGLSQAALAKQSGVTQSTIGNLESGARFSARRIANIADVLEVDVLWLAEGKGHPAKLPGGSVIPGAMIVNASDKASPSTIQIQKVELRLSAGITGFQTDPDRREDGVWNIPKRWVEKNGFLPAKLLAIDVKGESMEPSLYAGDVVVINTADTALINGQVYAVNYEGEAVIKRLVREGGQWYLHSDNASPRFPKRVCRGAECIIVGKVVRRETDQI